MGRRTLGRVADSERQLSPRLELQHLVQLYEFALERPRRADPDAALELAQPLLREPTVVRMLPRVLDCECVFACALCCGVVCCGVVVCMRERGSIVETATANARVAVRARQSAHQSLDRSSSSNTTRTSARATGAHSRVVV